VEQLWPYHHELFEPDAVDDAAALSGLGPCWAELREAWQQRMATELRAATLLPGADSAFRSRGRQGVHSEHMGHLLAEMQYLQRAYPGGSW
jgi:ring-1,2-phenylacetyl-CoA epoxidase subunit PaaC